MTKLNDLIKLIAELPGVGKKSSERMAIKLVENNVPQRDLLNSINKTLNLLEIDTKTNIIIEKDKPKKIDSNKPLMIVMNNLEGIRMQDLFEDSYNFFNLNINTISDITKRINDNFLSENLTSFITTNKIKEIIFAFSPKAESEIIIRVLSSEIMKRTREAKITKLATGIPVGGSLEHIDSKTIRKAIENREKI